VRVTHFYKDTFPPVYGGIEQHIALLSEMQQAAGWDVEIVAAGARNAARERLSSGVVVHRLGEVGRFASSPVTAAFLGAARRTRADIAHFHHPNPIGEVAEPLLSADIPRVMSYHADITRQRVLGALYRPILRRILSHMDAVIVGSEPMLDSSPMLADLHEVAHVVPYGVRQFSPAGPVGREPSTFLFVGRLRRYKGLPVLLRALARTTGLDLRIVGSGPLQAELEQLCGSLGLAGRVCFLRDLSDGELDREYRRARALVLPSTDRSEAFGIVLAEALSRGTPCISTEVGTATSWVNLHGESGLVVEPGDPRALRRALELLAADDDLWHRLSAGATRRARMFSAAAMTDATLALYSSLHSSLK
jgi:glycosyltransferase involved in cell wall biosynthesis